MRGTLPRPLFAGKRFPFPEGVKHEHTHATILFFDGLEKKNSGRFSLCRSKPLFNRSAKSGCKGRCKCSQAESAWEAVGCDHNRG